MDAMSCDVLQRLDANRARRRRRLLVTVLLLATNAMLQFAQADDLLPYFPLSLNRSFVYKCYTDDGKQSEQASVQTTASEFPGMTAFEQSDANGCLTSQIFDFRPTAAGIEIARWLFVDGGQLNFQPPALFLPAEATQGQVFTSSGSIAAPPGSTMTYDAVVRILGYEEIRVPAGLFKRTLKVEQTLKMTTSHGSLPPITQRNVHTAWFAREIGEVKRIEKVYAGGQHHSTLTVELKYPGPGCQDPCEQADGATADPATGDGAGLQN